MHPLELLCGLFILRLSFYMGRARTQEVHVSRV